MYTEKLMRAERWLREELWSYNVAARVDGQLSDIQAEARDAIRTAYECVLKVKEENENG